MAARTVTIVTPSYNQGRFIRATIESVLAQDYPALEYLIMDGGSTDETAAVAREYAGRLTFLSEPDRGQSHAINKGFRRARGEIVAWLNSDDTILPGAVARAVAALERHPEAGAVYGEGYRMDAEGRRRRFPATEPFNLWKLVYLSDYVLQQTVYFRKNALEEAGYLDEELHYAMDWDILIRIARQRPLAYIPDYQGCLREYPEAKTFAGGKARIREIGAMLRRHTGMRYPPGYLAYALDDLQKRWLAGLDRRAPRWAAWPARALVYGATAYAIMRLLRDSQGWLPDGWASDRVRWMMPPGSGPLVVRGAVPETEPRLRGQVLAVWSGGRLLARRPVGPGEFRLEAPVSSPEGPLELELRATRWRRTPLLERGTVRRRAYVLKEVQWGQGTGDGGQGK